MIRSVIQTTMASSLRAGLKTTPSSSVLLQLSKNLTTKAFANSLLAQHPKNQVASVRCLGRLPARFSSTQTVNQGEAVKENIETIVVEPPRTYMLCFIVKPNRNQLLCFILFINLFPFL